MSLAGPGGQAWSLCLARRSKDLTFLGSGSVIVDGVTPSMGWELRPERERAGAGGGRVRTTAHSTVDRSLVQKADNRAQSGGPDSS